MVSLGYFLSNEEFSPPEPLAQARWAEHVLPRSAKATAGSTAGRR